MSELFKIILTSSLTILGGITAYVMGRFIEKFFIEPIHEQFRLIGEIADSLIFYANVYSSPGSESIEKERMDEASNALRQQASQLMAKTQTIRCYRLWHFLKMVLDHADITEAHSKLIALSNSIHRGDAKANNLMRKDIEKRLRIRTEQ